MYLRLVILFGTLLVFPLIAIAEQQERVPVLVELFTSEGCSSCPPADALFVQLRKEAAAGKADLLLLGEHVDYWNELGWKDRFSSADFSRRQQSYAGQMHLDSVYTPQIVIDGQLQTVGNDEREVRKYIAEASGKRKLANVSAQWSGPGKLRFNVTQQSPRLLRLFVAVTEDDLTTQVRAGENGGRTLRHTAVVRELRNAGDTREVSSSHTSDLHPQKDWNRANLRAVIFAQDAATGVIVGATSLPL